MKEMIVNIIMIVAISGTGLFFVKAVKELIDEMK